MAETTATEGCTYGAAALLPEDVLFEVFSRVQNVIDLLRCAMTCKPWLRLFTDRAFLDRLWPDHGHGQGHRSHLLGFFFQQTSFGRRKRKIKTRMRQHSAFAPTFLPTPWSPLGQAECALTSFISDDDGTFNYAEPLAARRGIVLMRLIPRTFERTVTTGLLVGLCNPITDEHHVAPPLECTCLGRYLSGYAIVTAADDGDRRRPSSSSGSYTFSRLLVTGHHQDDRHLHLHTYSAATRSWSTPTTKCLHSDRFRAVGARAAVVHRGAAHWLYIDRAADARVPQDNRIDLYALRVEMGTARVSFTKLPVTVGWSPHLCVSGDGRFSITSVFAVHVEVWTQQDGDDGGETAVWLRTRVIRIPPAAPEPHSFWSLQHREWFDFDTEAMLALYEGDGVFVLDMEREAVEKVMVCPPCLSITGT